jgi:uncharacterized membrane protein (TIGR02234 family)
MADAPERPERRRRGSFGPTVLGGVAGAGLAAVAAGRDWATASVTSPGVRADAAVTGSTSAPLAIALALVALAAWGVVLVVRGRLRRLVAVVGALASAGVVVTAVASQGRVRADAARAVEAKGVVSAAASDASLTAWYVTCVVAAVVAMVAFAVAVAKAAGWPAMGSRYDAPAARAEAPVHEQDMWRALDEGRDPTD